MELQNLTESLVSSREKDDFVLVFVNPFDGPDYTCEAFKKSYTKEKARKNFDKFFRVDQEAHLVQEFLDEIDNAPGDEISEKMVMQLVVRAVLKIVQDYLMLHTKAHLSVDSDEIFVLLKASEENLKVGADLMDLLLTRFVPIDGRLL